MKWSDYFCIRRVGKICYVSVKGKPSGYAISPDFTTQGQARSWIKARWRDLLVEEIMLK